MSAMSACRSRRFSSTSRMMKGFKNVLFGGDGLFLATLSGPGKVWLQSMPIVNLAEEVFRHAPGGGSQDAGGVVGGVLGGLLRG